MPRITPSDRLAKLLDAAAGAFVEHGFQRTQMDDIAERLGVSKGTVYRAVDSKESLFAAVIEWGDAPDSAPATGLSGSADLAAVAVRRHRPTRRCRGIARARHDRGDPAPAAHPRAFGDEIERITVELHRLMRSRRTAVMVLDRCAGEIPELAAVWFGEGRYALVDLWADYLDLRSSLVTTDVDRAILARTIVETVTTWAVKMPWDRAPRPYPDDTADACAAMIRNLVIGAPR